MNLGDEEFDAMLTRALKARPEQAASFDVAGEAMRRAQVWQASEMRLRRLAFWRRVSTAAAMLMIAAIVVIGYLKFPASTETETAAVETTAATIDLTTLGVTALVLTLVGIVLATMLSSERPQFRVLPT